MAKRGHPKEQSKRLDGAEQSRLLCTAQTQLSAHYAAHPELWDKLCEQSALQAERTSNSMGEGQFILSLPHA